MKYASAMKYGGELVDAVDCDYDSFKELIPLCPNCKEPVFLRIGGQRESVKGKAYQIGPHWCHFKGISAEYGDDGFEGYIQTMLSRPQDLKISLEVLHFLASRQNFHLLKSFLDTLASCLWSAARSMYDGDEDEVQDKWWEDPLSALYLWVFEIPWASEFQRLETEAKQRKGAA
jgi:hypothetical protein